MTVLSQDTARRLVASLEPASGCELGCTVECLARVHGCPSECPALPWKPPADRQAPTPTAQVVPLTRRDRCPHGVSHLNRCTRCD